MSSGITHITTVISVFLGVLFGIWCGKRYKQWRYFYFMLAVFTGWVVHIVYDVLVL